MCMRTRPVCSTLMDVPLNFDFWPSSRNGRERSHWVDHLLRQIERQTDRQANKKTKKQKNKQIKKKTKKKKKKKTKKKKKRDKRFFFFFFETRTHARSGYVLCPFNEMPAV